MTRRYWLTAIELISLLLLIGAVSAFVVFQLNDLRNIEDDKQRKTAINAIHHSLEEIYYTENNSYPSRVDASTLPTTIPDLFNDPQGQHINDKNSDYHYEPLGCQGNECQGYYLYADMVKEARYEKRSIQ